MEDWTENKKSIFITLAASNHTIEEREENDYYATEPEAAKFLLELESFNNVLEPACGEGHLSKIFLENGLKVTSSDLIDRGFGIKKDFFSYESWDGDIITNPPYRYAKDFVEHSLKITKEGSKIAMFLKLLFLESKGRKSLFLNNPFKTLYVSSSRINCARNGDFNKYSSSAVAYGWFVWIKGYKGNPIIKWFN